MVAMQRADLALIIAKRSGASPEGGADRVGSVR